MASQMRPKTRSSKEPQPTASTSSAVSENNSVLLPPVRNNNNNTLARWPLSKYANFIISQRQGVGTWQERSAGEPNEMWIQITKHRYIQILDGEELLECINLSESQGVWKAIRRGPNMLVLNSDAKEKSRKFRIRFQKNNQEEPSAVASDCACHLSRFISLYDADRQGPSDDHHAPSCTTSVKQLASAVLDPQNSKWPAEYADFGDSFELVPDLLRSCLMDPNFPSLVEAVENSLKKLMNSEI